MRRLALLVPLLLLGCQQPAPHLSGSGMDMFTPVKLRLHPLSRITPAATQPAAANPGMTVEARLEFSDQFTDAGKGVGEVIFQLFEDAAPALTAPTTRSAPPSPGTPAAQPAATHKGKPLGEWRFSLDTPEANREHWDRTTRTYLFRIPLASNLKGDHFILAAAATLPNRAVLVDELPLTIK